MNSKLFQTLIASFLIHLFLWIGLSLFKEEPIQTASHPVEVDYIGSEKKSIVTQTEVPQKLKEAIKNLKNKAKLLSKRQQRVQKEVIAQKTGVTKNRPSGKKNSQVKNHQQAPKTSPGLNKQLKRQIVQDLKSDILAHRPSSRGVKSRVPMGGISTFNGYVPNVKEGSFTSLNTDQFLYYTYFARVNQRVSHRWTNEVKDYMKHLSYTDLRRLSVIPRVTKVEVLLDKQGRYKKTYIRRSSGYPLLDQTAIEGFIKATPLPNPPLEMLEDDGYIHLNYSFMVIFDSRRFVRRGER